LFTVYFYLRQFRFTLAFPFLFGILCFTIGIGFGLLAFGF
jgi:hypothetical protein